MSNIPSGGRGVSTAQLVVFILVILASGVAAYVFWTETDGLRTQYNKEVEGLGKDIDRRNEHIKIRADVYEAIGLTSPYQLEQTFAASPVKIQTTKLEDLVDALLNNMEQQTKELGLEVTDIGPYMTVGNPASDVLGQTLNAFYDKSKTPPPGKKLALLLAEKERRDKALADRATARQTGEDDLRTAVGKINTRRTEQNRIRLDWDGKIAQARREYIVERDKNRTEPPKWAKEGAVLQSRLDGVTADNKALEDKRKIQTDPTSPIDGRIVAYDYRTRTGTVNLGARDRVKAGYAFDIYTTRPGPEGPEKRIMLGQLRLFNVRPETSLFRVIPSVHESAERPIMIGHYVRSELYDRHDRKVFVLKGWFPEGGDHSKAGLAGLIFKNGGIVEDALTRRTDYLVLGVFDEKDVPNPSAAAKRAIAEGADAYKQATQSGIATILGVPKLLKYMDRTGQRTIP